MVGPAAKREALLDDDGAESHVGQVAGANETGRPGADGRLDGRDGRPGPGGTRDDAPRTPAVREETSGQHAERVAGEEGGWIRLVTFSSL